MHTHLSHAHMVLYIQLSMIILSSLSYAISYTSYTLTSHSPVIHSTFLSAFFSFIDTSLSYILVSLVHTRPSRAHSSLLYTSFSFIQSFPPPTLFALLLLCCLISPLHLIILPLPIQFFCK
ncbi:hypothetical protein OTU49_001467 [Cherax quadricarinatus]|uniref:Uncharacterized protein n=1 Tax=Cherax quadricarinatus TaxID=27406 RepID=A0AAW0YCV8_CHEQU